MAHNARYIKEIKDLREKRDHIYYMGDTKSQTQQDPGSKPR